MTSNRLPLIGALIFSLLCSCIGISTDITIRRDGSGTILMEYRISRELESLGKLDGNERWPPAPVGKADFERTVARVQGLTLKSFQSRTQGKDMVNRVSLEFANLDALLRFLDAVHHNASLVREGGRNRLSLTLGDGQEGIDPDLAALVTQALEGYTWDLTVSLPAQGEFLVLDRAGQAPASQWVSRGSGKGSYSAPMGELINARDPPHLEIRWKDHIVYPEGTDVSGLTIR